MSPLLAVEQLRRPGLSPLDLTLEPGDCMAVSGPSGAGKSLLLRALADLDPNQGRALLDGQAREDLPAPEWRRQVAYLAPEPGWWAARVGEHFDEWSGAWPWLERLGISEDLRARPVEEVSTGERQRIALVRAILKQPRVWLLDEPTSALDADATCAVEEIFAEQLGAGACALWVTHDAEQARRVAGRRLHVEAGRARELEA